MKPLFECKVNYFPSPHLNQIYVGFSKLEKAGIVKLSVEKVYGESTKPILEVYVNNKYKVVYDTLDGLNWIKGSVEDNLSYFKANFKADFYFKRSFNQRVVDYAPNDCKVFPLGLNYTMKADGKFSGSVKQRIKNLLKQNIVVSRLYGKREFNSIDFEAYPIPQRESKILFMARLWNPDDVSLEHLKIEREQINKNRIEYIQICRQEFGDRFIGGLQYDDFSKKHSKNLLLPFSLTKKENFLRIMKECNICIATTGLHDSTGWKFGEYVASSRAIVTEPLKYRIPGIFKQGENYLEFENTSELVNNIRELLNDNEKTMSMMKNNFHYYNNYVQPDKLILNTLLKIYENE
jgi:hypothetical protein